MKQVLKIVEKISSLQYIGLDSAHKQFRIESTVVVRKGQTVLVKHGKVIGVVRSENMITYNV